MQALIITCLLCLQTQSPCDSNQLQDFSDKLDCSKCLNDLRNYFKLPNDNNVSSNSIESIHILANSAENDISPELKENLESLLVDSEIIVESMKQDPDELHDLVNKMKIEINENLIPGIQSHGAQSGKTTNAKTLKKVQKQEFLLEKINGKFGDIFHQSEVLKEKFKIMRGILSLGDFEEETKKRRDTVKHGEKLMIGEELVSRNGKWKYLMDPKTGESVMFDDKGNEVKRNIICDFPKPIGQNLHLLMNNTVEYYLYILNVKSANMRCAAAVTMPCADWSAQCYLRLDNDGHLKLFLPSGEPSFTYY